MIISIFAPCFFRLMNKVLVFFFCFFATIATAQIHEIGIFAGGSNFIGDVGKENYIAPNSLAIGGVYKWNKSPRHAWRASFMYSNLQIDDAKASSSARQERNFSLENTVKEVSLGLEFNFFDFNLHDLDFKMTPYVHTGLSYFWYDSMYFVNGQPKKDDLNGALAIPITLGFKMRIGYNWILGAESGVRYTFVDDLDGSNPKNDRYEHLSFGNINSNDWYVFSGFTLTYTFGKNPCYCPL